MGKRVTLHNQKGRRGRGFSAAHNDRTNTEKAEHINEEKSVDNRYWTHDGNRDFVESELRFYDKTFRTALEEKNSRYIKNRHPERCQTMIDYYKSEKSAPDETLLYVGKKGDTIDRDNLWKLAIAYRDWITKEYPQYKPLSIALHTDEGGAPHLHFRGVFIGHDKDGNAVVGMESALKEMGVERPDLKKKEGRCNNRKMTFTATCREKFQHLAKSAGIEIEVEPQEPSKSGFSLAAYQAKQEQMKASAATAQREAEEKRLEKIESRIESAVKVATLLEDEQMRLDGIKNRAKKEKVGIFGTGDEVVQLSMRDYDELLRMSGATAAAEAKASKEKEIRLDAEQRSADAVARISAAENRAKDKENKLRAVEKDARERINNISRQLIKIEETARQWLDAPPEERTFALQNAADYADKVNRAIVAYAVAERRQSNGNYYKVSETAAAMSKAVAYMCGSNSAEDRKAYVSNVIKAFEKQCKAAGTAIRQKKTPPPPPPRPSGSGWFPPPSSTNFSIPADTSLIKNLLEPECPFPVAHFDDSPDFENMTPEEIAQYFAYRDDY